MEASIGCSPVPLSFSFCHVLGNLYGKLGPKGVLVFDFAKSEGIGLDTKGAVALRDETLEYIMANFHVLKGDIDPQRDVGTVIVRRRK